MFPAMKAGHARVCNEDCISTYLQRCRLYFAHVCNGEHCIMHHFPVMKAILRTCLNDEHCYHVSVVMETVLAQLQL